MAAFTLQNKLTTLLSEARELKKEGDGYRNSIAEARKEINRCIDVAINHPNFDELKEHLQGQVNWLFICVGNEHANAEDTEVKMGELWFAKLEFKKSLRNKCEQIDGSKDPRNDEAYAWLVKFEEDASGGSAPRALGVGGGNLPRPVRGHRWCNVGATLLHA